jgi:hypothetical protein
VWRSASRDTKLNARALLPLSGGYGNHDETTNSFIDAIRLALLLRVGTAEVRAAIAVPG